jgi:hypothetical protein
VPAGGAGVVGQLLGAQARAAHLRALFALVAAQVCSRLVCRKGLLEVPAGGDCVFYIDSAGGSACGVLAVPTLLRYLKLKATAMVVGECSSAALLPFAVCRKRLVTPYSTFLFAVPPAAPAPSCSTDSCRPATSPAPP